VALPYFLLFEFLGPVIETLGAALTVIAFAARDLSLASFVGFTPACDGPALALD
jgi:hypothetical protein